MHNTSLQPKHKKHETKYMILRPLLAAILLLIFTSCKTKQTSVITGNAYDPSTNVTTLIQVPYGNIVIPGNWTKKSYSRSSHQTFFKNADTITIAVCKNPQQTYSVYSAGQSDKQFVSAFYKWDSEYWKRKGYQIDVLNDNSDNGYIIWGLKGNNVNAIFLFGAKKSLAYNFACFSSKWTDRQRIQFLVDLFYNN